MVISLYLLSAYWVLAALCNIRTTVITARDVRDIVWPVPVHVPRLTKRAALRQCFLRGVDITDDGYVLESYIMVGVETMVGLQIEISGPHKTEPRAMRIATEIANVPNQLPGNRPIEICSIP